MDPRQQRLNDQIEQTKRSLVSTLQELKVEVGTLQRQVAIAAGIAVGLLILRKVVGVLRARSRTSGA